MLILCTKRFSPLNSKQDSGKKLIKQTIAGNGKGLKSMVTAICGLLGINFRIIHREFPMPLLMENLTKLYAYAINAITLPVSTQRIYFLEQELKITTIKRKKADNNHMLELKTQTQSLLFWTLRTFVKCLVLVRHRLQLLKHSMFHKYTLAVSVKAGAGLTKVEV
jgi:hypothetical protein